MTNKKLYRTQVMLDPDQYRELMELAEKEGKSFSRMVREVLEQYLIQEAKVAAQRRKREALERARRVGDSIRKDHGGRPIEFDADEIIRTMREERSNELGKHSKTDRN